MSPKPTHMGLKQSLKSLVTTKFNVAQNAQDLKFSETQVAILKTHRDTVFQLRYCPALARKPVDNKHKPEDGPPKPKPDPFDNPSETLLVAGIPDNQPTHNLVLNKFPIIHNHFILATKDNKPQTDLLEQDDLNLTYQCIKAWKDQDTTQASSLFAFFNSGEHSGASQPHRHVQFLPVEDMREDPSDGWSVLAETMTVPCHPHLQVFYNPTLPVLSFAVELQPDISSQSLHEKYVSLLKLAYVASQNPSRPIADLTIDDAQVTEPGDKRTIFSYNLAMTLDTMAVFPRRNGDAGLTGHAGSVGINGTILAGTLMVKEEADWDVLRDRPEMMDDILTQIGYPVNGVLATSA